ncbi:MAG: ABC transporter permease [Firmicutes bacterium]|nr:ABC transporter permease [Bacillota bacterium]
MSTIRTIWSEHIEWRGQILKLAKADLIKEYSGTALGWAWALVKPTLTIMVFWFAFTYGLRGGGAVNGYPFILWMMPGFVAWFFMGDMISGGASAIRRYRYLVTKLKFPVSTIPTFVTLSTLAVHLVLVVIVMLLYIITGHFPDIYWVQLPFYTFFMALYFVSWGLFASMFGAMSRDFLNMVKSVKQPIFWLSGILWDVNKIHIPWLQKVLYFNPVTYFATGYRNCFIYKTWFWEEPLQLGIFLFLFIIMILLAVWSYRRLLREIPDVL